MVITANKMSSIQDPNYPKRLREPEDDAGPSGPKKAKPEPVKIGIDIGTSNSSAFIGNVQLPNPETGTPDFPSEVEIGGKTVKLSKRLLGLNPEDAKQEATNLGMDVGFATDADGNPKSDNSENPEKGAALYKTRLGGQDVEVTVDFFVAAALLPLFKTIKEHVQDHPVEICVGHPVNFNESKKERVKTIVKTLVNIFKIQLVEIKAVPEPVLAAYAFFTGNGTLANAFDMKKTLDVTVVDVGCGTTDCAVVRIRYLADTGEYQVEILGTAGTLLGGADLTAEIAKLLQKKDKTKKLDQDAFLEVAEKLKRKINTSVKQYCVHQMFPEYKSVMQATIKLDQLFTNNGQGGILDNIRSSFKKLVMDLAKKNGAENIFLLVGGGTNFKPFHTIVANRGGKTFQSAYGISKGAVAYIKENCMPIVSHPVAMTIGATSIGNRNDKKSHKYAKEKRVFTPVIAAGTVVEGQYIETIEMVVPKSRAKFTLVVDICQEREFTWRGEQRKKIEDIGVIRVPITKNQMNNPLFLKYIIDQRMSLQVDAFIGEEKVGSFHKLGTVYTENDEETSSVVSGDSLSKNLKTFMADSDPNSDEEESDSDEEESDSDEEDDVPEKKRRGVDAKNPYKTQRYFIDPSVM